MAFDLNTAVPVLEDDEGQMSEGKKFNIATAKPVQEADFARPIDNMPADVKSYNIFNKDSEFKNIAKEKYEHPFKSFLDETAQIAQVIRWPFWRMIEHPISTISTDLQQGHIGLDTMGKAAESFAPFHKISEPKTYADIWDNYYKAIVGEPAPNWYKILASYSTAGTIEPAAIKGYEALGELALTRPATAAEASFLMNHPAFSKLRSALQKGGIEPETLHPEGNRIQLSDGSELIMNNRVSAVLRGKDIRVPRWSKIPTMTEGVPAEVPVRAPETAVVPKGVEAMTIGGPKLLTAPMPQPAEISPTTPQEAAKPTIVEGNWEVGQERAFAFDPNSTKNEGRFRLLPPDAIQKDTYFRRKSSTDGVSYVIGKDTSGKEAIQAIRFDKSKFTEQQAAEWWNKNKDKYQFAVKSEVAQPASNLNVKTIPEKGMTQQQAKPSLDERLAKVEEAKLELEQGGEVEKYLLANKIKKYEDGFLAEELSALPRKYVTTKKEANTIDQALDELRSRGFDFESEYALTEYLKNWDSRKKELQSTIEQNKPQKVTKFETTIAKEKQAIIDKAKAEAEKEMKDMTEAHAKIAEKWAKDAFEKGKLEGREIKEKRYFGEQIAKEERKKLYNLAVNKGLIYTDWKGKEHDMLRPLLSFYKGAGFTQLQDYISNLSGDPAHKPMLVKMYGDISKDTELLKLLNAEIQNWIDINKVYEMSFLDAPRIVEKVTGKDLWDDNILADNTIKTIQDADEAMFDRKVRELNDFENNKQNIVKGSKASAALMEKFENKQPMTEKEQSVANYLRKKYDEWINEANQFRAMLNKKPIPYRKDYMTHIIEQNTIFEFFGGDDLRMDSISQEQLEAIRKGDYTKGNMPFNKFAQRRMGKETKFDAIGNYLEYMDVILREIYYSSAIAHSRRFINYALIRQPNAYKALDRWLSTIKGKPAIADQEGVGAIASSKPVMFLRSRIAANALIGNINFWATNLSNFSISYDELGNWMNVGMAKFLGNKEWRDFAFKNSIMLKGRSIDPDLDPTKYQSLQKLVGAVTNLIEYNNVGSTYVGAYHKAINELNYDKAKAMKYADAIARRTQAGYKPYEMNAWMRSNSGKVLSQFQSWSFNMLNHVIYDLKFGNLPEDMYNFVTGKGDIKGTRWGALITLIATSIAVNQIYQAMGLRGPYSVESYIPVLPGFNFRYYDISPVKILKDIKNSFTSKDKDTRNRARIRAVTMLGLPFGGAQVGRFLQGQILPPEHGKKNTEKRAGT